MNISSDLDRALRARAERRGPVKTVSIVVPFLNEAETLEEMHARITVAMGALAPRHEVIFVDDGSDDGGDLVVEALAAHDQTDGEADEEARIEQQPYHEA